MYRFSEILAWVGLNSLGTTAAVMNPAMLGVAILRLLGAVRGQP
jgi:hypothetical protein